MLWFLVRMVGRRWAGKAYQIALHHAFGLHEALVETLESRKNRRYFSVLKFSLEKTTKALTSIWMLDCS
jgi:hypothetical protein